MLTFFLVSHCLSEICVTNIFSSSVICLSLTVFTKCRSYLSLFFSFLGHFFCLEKSLFTAFFPVSFIVLAFTFRFMTHLNGYVLCVVSGRGNFFFKCI